MRPRSLFLPFFLVVTAVGVAVGVVTAYLVSARLMETLVRMEKRPLEMISGETYSIASETFHGLLDSRKEDDPVTVQTAKQDVLARIAHYSASGVRGEYRFAVLDDENRILVDSGAMLDSISLPSFSGSRETREVSFEDGEGRAVFGYHRFFPAWRWHILTLVHDEDLRREARGILFLLVASGTLALAVFLALSYFLFMRHIQKPLLGLVGHARRIMSGRYEAEPVTGAGEIGELSEAFHRMAEAIRKREKSLLDLARFTASNPNLVMKVDTEGRILYANTSVERALYGMGLPIQHGEMLLPDDAGEIARDVLASKGKIREVTFLAEGRTIVYTIFGFEGEESAVFHGVDVTERKAMEEQLLHSRKMETLGRIAGGVAHDFNNLLAGILGYASYLKSKPLAGSGTDKAVDNIVKAAERGAQLTRQLLGFARKGTHEHLPVALNRIVEEVSDLVSQTFLKNLSVGQEKAEDLPVVRGDATQLSQCLMNLCVNARDAMPDGGILTITTRRTLLREDVRERFFRIPAGLYATILVEDRGHGMDEATLERIFDPFFTTKEPQKGTGLGMALVYGIVKTHGGYVTVKSAPGEGTSVRIDLPASMEAIPEAEPAVESPPRERRDMRAGTALLVDDEELVRDVAGAMLSSLGYEVLTASDGREGVELFRRERDRISLTVLDLRMPVMDGKKAFEEIRSIDPSARVVISTGFSGDEDVGRMKAMGAAAILSKPYSYGEIARLVAELGECREPAPSPPPVEKE
ncbi:MAG TPA: hypothetical protein DD658_00450 [Deltaproteobacteria bacterium]|nr:MAG: hypothetical protein A2X88_02285 [Deltaproteobacteria bacterium GWC2_65_14]HBO68695.1 hypothetical protein [Deltaproteobacteria bacterium]